MISSQKLNRINELSRKAKTIGLTDVEKQERHILRQEYIKSFRVQVLERLKSIKIVDECGNDVTPEKLKLLKQQQNSLLQ
ncbi:DUF896 domain-containing protein [Ectobacillus sp. sgz5001026]|uniref:DUF896 domain-containing protein n=1 Tax=Ectobacillus sp. sgz5001026 TaxID=3242473 RepID=UPI0036D391EE